MAVAGLLLAGCASNPTSSPSPQSSSADALPAAIGDLPQAMLSGASRAEVKSLAMGAARSKGWTILRSGADRLIAQRALDPSTGLTAGGMARGSALEVTSFFLEQGGGVKVALKAELVSPAVGREPAARLDYTEDYRDALNQSLDSLRSAWSSSRDRLARATPPAGGWGDPWAGTPYARQSGTPAADPSITDEPAPRGAEPIARASEPETWEEPAPEPVRPVTSTRPSTVDRPAPRKRATPTPPGDIPSSAASRPAPEPRRRPEASAPVVDASDRLRAEPEYRFEHEVEDPDASQLSESENMMAMPSQTPSRGSVTWAAYAEQYARQRGCQVSSSGAQLIESRRDGEIHRVPCDGSDSFLVKCSDGICQGLL